jgi:GntR family transcriptional regulator
LSLAPYQEIARYLRDQILSGELAPGATVPSESELIERFGHNRRTIQRAIDLLRSEGLVISSQGARTTVRRRPSIFYVATGENFRHRQSTGKPNDIAEAEAQGYRGVNDLLAVEEVPAPAGVAERLGVPAGETVIMRHQINRADDEPMKVMRCYYRLEFAAGTPLAEFRLVRGGVANVIEAEDGPIRRRIDRFVEDIELRMPRPEEAGQLAIPPGVPVARILRTLYDPSGEPLEVLDSLLPGDRYLLRYVIVVPEKP